MMGSVIRSFHWRLHLLHYKALDSAAARAAVDGRCLVSMQTVISFMKAPVPELTLSFLIVILQHKVQIQLICDRLLKNKDSKKARKEGGKKTLEN